MIFNDLVVEDGISNHWSLVVMLENGLITTPGDPIQIVYASVLNQMSRLCGKVVCWAII